MTKRLFVAINFDVETKLNLIKAINLLPKHPDIAPTKIDNLHLTLQFLGDTAESAILNIQSLLDAICQKQPQLILKFDSLGAFPEWRSPKIIWLDIISKDLIPLQQQIHNQLSQLLALPVEKPFQPHLTLARVKTPIPTQMMPNLSDTNTKVPVFSPIVVKSVDLMESQLTSKGPIYTCLSTHHLQMKP